MVRRAEESDALGVAGRLPGRARRRRRIDRGAMERGHRIRRGRGTVRAESSQAHEPGVEVHAAVSGEASRGRSPAERLARLRAAGLSFLAKSEE